MNIDLLPGETVTSTFRLSPVALVIPVLVAAALSAAGGVAMVLYVVIPSPTYSMALALLAIFAIGLAGVILLVGYLTYRRTVLLLTNLRVIVNHQRSLFGSDIETNLLRSVQDARADVSLLGDFLGYGSVTVQTQGGVSDFQSFGPVSRPRDVVYAINSAVAVVPAA